MTGHRQGLWTKHPANAYVSDQSSLDHVQGRNVEVTPAIKEHVQAKGAQGVS